MSKENRPTAEDIKAIANNEADAKALLKAHLGTPEKVEWYYKAMKKDVDGKGRLKASAWSWWALIGGVFFFLYRKMYGVAAALVITVIGLEMFVPKHSKTGAAGMAIACGLIGITSYFGKFFADAKKAGYGKKPLKEVEKEMEKLGGYNTWAVYACMAITALAILAMILFPEEMGLRGIK